MATDVENILDDLVARVGRVRRWLIALGVLRIAAFGLACLTVYTTLYVCLDRRLHFGHMGRLAAFVLLVALLVVLGYCLVRALRRDLTYAHAAGYIENRESFHQQLIAAVEYYENRADYPYSESLARQLVLQVDRTTRTSRFDSTVDKRHVYLLAGFTLWCLVLVGFFVQRNVFYFSSYLARLIQPFSAIEPPPATTLKPTTGDVVTGPNVPVTLTAAVEGRVPESAALVLTRLESQDANPASNEIVEEIEADVTTDAEGSTIVTATTSFDALERLAYRFQAGDVRSEPHEIHVCAPPAIKDMVAEVTPPSKSGMPTLGTYTQPIDNQTLQVLPYSTVELEVETTPIQRAIVTDAEARSVLATSGAGKTFKAQFKAVNDMTLRFDLVGPEGLANNEPLELKVQLKSDQPPQFKLLCPEGDYLTTNVASLPFAFEVTDDFGLEAMRLCCELPNAGKTILQSADPQGARQAYLTHTLELEEYELHVGDGILFYAEADDVQTGHQRENANACSEVYFIEIRPYRQYWHTQAGGGPNSQPGMIPDDLTTILEYTRAILKKTWPLARISQFTAEHRWQIDALTTDVEYCADALTKLRDDPEMGFSDQNKAALTEIVGCYQEAADCFDRYDATTALASIRKAYRLLRAFVDELHLQWSPPQSGQSVPQEKPERVKLQEEPEAPEMDKERVESRLEKLQQKIDALKHQQDSLKADMDKALQQTGQGQSGSPSTGDPSSSENEGPSSGKPSDGRDTPQRAQGNAETDEPDRRQAARDADTQRGGDQTGAGQEARPSDSGQGSQAEQSSSANQGDGNAASSPGQESGGQGTTGTGGNAPSETPSRAQEDGSPSSGSVPTDTGAASDRMDALLRLLGAKQQSLRRQTSAVDADLKHLPLSEHSTFDQARDEAQEHLDRAIEQMKQLEDTLADLRYQAPVGPERKNAIAPLTDSASRRLDEAREALARGLAGEKGKSDAEQAREMAEQLAQDAEAFDESVGPLEKADMLARLEAAKRLLERMGEPQWATVSGGGAPGAAHVYTRNPRTTRAEEARLLAREFWSIALQSRDRAVQPVEDEASDIEFFEAENEFFESAAKYKPPRDKK